jgi:exosome complex component RRP42
MANRILSDQERFYIVNGVKNDLRGDGRGCKDHRHFELHTEVVSNTNGSAEIKLERTSITVGVKAEIGAPHPSTPDCGRIEFYVDCSGLASPKFEGQEGHDLGQHLAQSLSDIYMNSKAIDLTSLCIIPSSQCWVLYVDALVCTVNRLIIQWNLFNMDTFVAIQSATISDGFCT